MLFAVAVTLASPPAMIVTGLPVSAAEGPDAGGVKITFPFATGSTGLTAATVRASGLAKAVLMRVDCGVLPTIGVSVKP